MIYLLNILKISKIVNFTLANHHLILNNNKVINIKIKHFQNDQINFYNKKTLIKNN